MTPLYRYPALIVFAACLLFLSGPGNAQQKTAGPLGESLRYLIESPDYKELSNIPGLLIDLRYASKNNFMGVNLYGDFNRAFLHKDAEAKLRKANAILQKNHPDLRLLVLDAVRPRSVQKRLFEKVRNTPQQIYVANPEKGSIHNYGFAVDITLADQNGKELDMGTPFDDFTRLSQPRHEKEYLKIGTLTQKQFKNRLILRKAMERAGFIQLPVEWWHFDALPGARVRANYKIIE